MTVAIFGFIGSWNSLMWPLLVVQTDEWRPIAYGLLKFVSSDAPNDLHLQMAAAVIMIIPILNPVLLHAEAIYRRYCDIRVKGIVEMYPRRMQYNRPICTLHRVCGVCLSIPGEREITPG